MKDWETAAASYREYLDLKGEIAERDRVGLKLAECFWELEDYLPAAEVLQEVSQNTSSADLAFRARLLRARVHARMGDFEIVNVMVDELRKEASIYAADGDVILIEAEALLAQDKPDEAAPLLQSMPAEWETPAVKARAAEILGQIFLTRGNWDKARENLQTALMNRDALEDEDLARRLNDNLKDYLAAEQALPDAKGNRVARLKLLQANSLLFGFDRPHMAATLYTEAAVDTAADTTVAARAYYGAYLTYDRYLDQPDSAEIFRAGLETRFPDSPQAFEARSDSDTDLLGYLLAIRAAQQNENYAKLSATEKAALRELGDVDTAGTRLAGRPLAGVRRRMVYFARRENLIFEPPAGAVAQITERQQQLLNDRALDSARQAQFDSLQTLVPTGPGAVATDPGVDEFGRPPPVDPNDPLAGTELDPQAGEQEVDPEGTTDDQKDKDDPDAKDKDEKKKKQDENWDFLR
jgi:predicted negative regulator of RcsB-dependent stress response